MKKSLKQVMLTAIALLLILSTTPLNAFAMISLEPSSVDSSIPLSVSPSLQGQNTWYYDGVTRIVNDTTGDQIGDAYRYRDSFGNTTTMINPGSLGNWVDAFGGNRNDVIAMYSSGSIQTYRMSPPSPKVAFDRLKIDDVISASSANYRYANGMIYVTVPEGNPKVTKFKIREVAEKACYYIGDTVNIDIDIQEYLASSTTLKSVEVYQEMEGYSPSTLKSWTNITTDSSGKVTLSVPYKISSKAKVKFYIRAIDSLSRFDQDTENLQRTVGVISPVGLSIELCGENKSFSDEGTIPLYQGKYDLRDDFLLDGQLFYRVDDTSPTGELILGYYRYPTLYDGNINDATSRSSLNTSFTVNYPFKKNGGY
ncbi:TPA: hypothetical protein NJY08_004996, partial [Salmonella enterica subsp. enterica serovar Typhi str. AG3]|nr:hypothetical protein [Salmonella enterica subsp. enterica serovar Typhi str. AG3]